MNKQFIAIVLFTILSYLISLGGIINIGFAVCFSYPIACLVMGCGFRDMLKRKENLIDV